MAARPSGERRKRRCVMATDAEWACIREAADAAGLSVSEHVVRAGVAPPARAGAEAFGLPASVLRRQAQVLLTLGKVEKSRLERLDPEGAPDLWRRLVAEADAWLDAEAALE